MAKSVTDKLLVGLLMSKRGLIRYFSKGLFCIIQTVAHNFFFYFLTKRNEKLSSFSGLFPVVYVYP